MKIKNNSKKAQLGLTLTWFVAFLVIVVIMVIYLVTVVVLAGKKKVGDDFHEIGIENSVADKTIEMQQDIEYLLNSPVTLQDGTAIQTRDLILLWYKDEKSYKDLLKESVKKSLDGLEYEFYMPDTENWRVAGFSVSISSSLSGGEAASRFISITGDKYRTGYVGGNTLGMQIPNPSGAVNIYLSRSIAPKEVYG